jgi:hypothetical protein
MKHFTLAAFSAERRAVAVALFRGTRLEHTRIRRLIAVPDKAFGSVRELVRETLERHQPEFLVIASPAVKSGDRIRGFCGLFREIASLLDIPVIEVDDKTLMGAYGRPPLVRKEHLRQVGRTIWPSLNEAKSKSAAVDAALAGLYVQTERLFRLNEANT